MIRVLVVSDQPALLKGLRMLLATSDDTTVIAEADDACKALSLCLALSPDVVLIDAEMRSQCALEAAQALHKASPATQVVMLSLYDDPDTRTRVRQAGAAGFASKHQPADMLAAIRAAARWAPGQAPGRYNL